MRKLPAAAIPKGTVVLLDGAHFGIQKVENATPVAGRITWVSQVGRRVEVGGADRIQVVSLP